MRTLLLLWLALAGACARLRCPDGQPCPATPVSAQGWGGYGGGVPATVGNPLHGPPPRSCLPAARQCARTAHPAPPAPGVPCAGGRHCCPRGSRCSADGKSCITSLAPRAVPCPDGQSECPDDATCCMTTNGTWGCCPMPQVRAGGGGMIRGHLGGHHEATAVTSG
uniref:Granulin precursor n=1 Tax=Accipiter nisus TaxID=211598 RepID=A0A8B9RX69_9AVES